MIGAYFVVGLGVAIGLHIEMVERHPERWTSYTMGAGLILTAIFWPVPVIALLTLILCRLADR
jgi:hypothetical protein